MLDKGYQINITMQLNDLLLEKLIKYPPSVYEKFDKVMTKYILSYYFHAHAEYPQHKRAAKAMMKKYGVPFVKDSKIINKGASSKASFEEIIVDWPDGYPEPEPDFDQLLFIVTKELPKAAVKMEYDPEWASINAYLPQYTFDTPLEDPDEEDNIEDIKDDIAGMMTLMKYDLGHELMHFVQDKSIGLVYSKKDRYERKSARRLDKTRQTVGVGDPVSTGQNKALPGYHAGKKNYYLSPNEYDPTIQSEIGEFINDYKPTQDLTTQIRDHLAKGDKQNPTFFSILRTHDKPRYQRAAKKFVTGINDVLSQRT